MFRLASIPTPAWWTAFPLAIQIFFTAYQILSHPDLRFAYDTRWKERQLLQEFPVEDEMYLEDMEEYDSNYTYPCRCGDEYTLTVTDVRLRYDYAACGSCSLCIRIIYPKNDPVELNQLANTNISDT